MRFSVIGGAAWFDEHVVAARAAAYAQLLEEARQGFSHDQASAGWMALEETASESVLRRIEKKAAEIAREADVFVLIGVGGSNNAARAVIESMTANRKTEIVYAGTATAPSSLERVLARMKDRSVYVNVIAKNFETLEPGAAFRVIRKEMYRRYGSDAARRIMATGTPGSRLHQLCEAHGWDFFTFPKTVGGRYSAFTDVGLLPMAVAGADIRAFVRGAQKMQTQLLNTPACENPALLYAAARTLLYDRGYRVEFLTFFEPRLSFFAKWWLQLFGESEGKRDKGLLPHTCECSEELHALGQFLQQGTPIGLETFLCMEEVSKGPSLEPDDVDDGFGYLDTKHFCDLNEAALAATMEAHSRHLPCLRLETGCCTEETFGGMYFFFMLACVFSCRMLGVDPFDGPGVETYKQSMFSRLGKETI